MEKKNYKNLIVKIVSMIVQFIVTLILTNIIVGKMGEVANGFYQLSNDFVNYGMIVSIALNSMASRFITMEYYNNNGEEVNFYYNSLLYGDVVLALAFIFPMIIVILNLNSIISIPKEYIVDVKILFLIMFINFLVTVATSVFSTATFVKNRIDLDSYRVMESNIIKILIIVLLYSFFKPQMWYIAFATLISTFYIMFVNIYYTRKLMPDVKIFRRKFVSLKHLKKLAKSGLWNSFTKIGSILLSGLDLLIANQMIGSSAMGVLSISKTIPKYIFTAMSNIGSVFTPSILIEYAKGKKDELINTINISIKICSILSVVLEIIMIVLGERIFSLWVPGQNIRLLQLLSVIAMLGYIILMPFEVLWSVFTATDKVKISSIYLFIESIFTIFFVFIQLHFTSNDIIKLIIVAGTSTVFELLRGITFLPLMSSYLIGVSFKTFYKPLLRVICSFFISFLFGKIIMFIDLNNNFMSLLFYMFLLIVETMIICCAVLFSKDERKKIINLLIKKGE